MKYSWRGLICCFIKFSVYDTWEHTKKSYGNNKLKISTQAWNNKFELADGSYSISDIQDYFEYIIKNIDNRPIEYILIWLKTSTFTINTGSLTSLNGALRITLKHQK